MSNYNISDCLTFGIVLLFLLGTLIVGSPHQVKPMSPLMFPYQNSGFINENEGIIEQFTEPGKVIGGVDKGMLELYNKY